MVKFGTYVLPRVLSIQKQRARQLQEVILPGREFPYRKPTAGLGSTFTVTGGIRPASRLVKDEIDALADGTARILDLEESDLIAVESCLQFPSQVGNFNSRKDDYTWTGNLYAQKFLQPENGTLHSINFFSDIGGGVGVAIYSHDAGGNIPNVPLTTKQTITSVAGQRNTVVMSSGNRISMVAGTYYWIIYEIANGNGVCKDSSSSTEQRHYIGGWTYGSAFPNPWAGSSGYSERQAEVGWAYEVYKDNTAEAKTAAGTPFALLNADSDYRYVGHREKLNKLQFDLQTLGDYGGIAWEYSKGNGAWGTISPTFTPTSKALVFDGNDYGNCGNLSELNGNTKFTVEAVVKPSTSTNVEEFVRRENTFGFGFGWAMHKPLFWICSVESGWINSGSGPNDIDGENWHKIQGVFDGQYIRLYIDGTHASSSNVGPQTIGTWAYDLMLATNNGVVENFIGKLKNVRIYANRALTSTEISEHQNGIYTDETGLVLYLPMREGSGTTTADESGYGHNGTITGATWDEALFSEDRIIIFTPPSDWKQDTVNSIANKFWLRVKAASVATAATVNQILLNSVFNCLMLNPQFREAAEQYNRTDYSLTFAQSENP